MGDLIQMPKRPVFDKDRQEFLDKLKEKIRNGEVDIDTEIIARKIVESGVLDE